MTPGEMMDFMKLAILGLVMVVPVVGFTVRFALRPLISARMGMGPESQRMIEQRMGRLEAEVDRLADLGVTMERLTEELEFQRKLALPAAAPGAERFSA
jgi:hypothetical protein